MSPRVRALPNANEQRLGCMLRIASWKQCPSFGLSQCAGTGHLEGSDQRLLSSVSSPNWSCCVLHEWPVFPPPGSAVDLALAAFSAQRENRIHRLGSHLPFAAFAHKISVEAGSDRRQCGLSCRSVHASQRLLLPPVYGRAFMDTLALAMFQDGGAQQQSLVRCHYVI
jgi:hypothetical protein